MYLNLYLSMCVWFFLPSFPIFNYMFFLNVCLMSIHVPSSVSSLSFVLCHFVICCYCSFLFCSFFRLVSSVYFFFSLINFVVCQLFTLPILSTFLLLSVFMLSIFFTSIYIYYNDDDYFLI